MNTLPRRRFLKTTAALAAASTLPDWFQAECQAQDAAKTAADRDKPAVALVGCGGMGRGDAKNASRFGRITMLCDVDESHLTDANKQWPEAKPVKDFRQVMENKDVQVVICGTVDHWHTLVSMAAMRAGKDVYCEKPLTLTVEEGQQLIKTARETKRILQTGSQQRSDKNFRLACELVRNGRIGKIRHVNVWLPSGRREGPFQTSPVPASLNWDMWLGQTPKVDYIKERCHVTFRYWWDHSGGTMTDWGAHHNDIALWALGYERSGPVKIEGKPSVEMIPGGFSAASEYEVLYTYANGVTHRCQSTPGDAWNGAVVEKDGQRNGVKFEGSDGWIWVTRGQITASDPEMLKAPLTGDAVRLYASNDHMGNFFDCVRTRRPTICEPEIGHRSASVCHLGVIAIRLNRPLQWDPSAEKFVDDAEANQWLRREMRAPWSYDAV